MKKTLIALFAIATIAACSKVDVVSDSTERAPICFDQIRTRAAVEGPADIAEFGVWGQVMDAETSILFPLFVNEKVYQTKDENGNAKWIYDNEEYWVNNMTFRFFALHPYEEDTDGTRVKVTGTENINYSVNFETPDNADTDLMAAFKTETIANGIYPESVNLKFSHLLTKMNVKVLKDFEKNENDNFYIQNIKITGIKKSGEYIREQLVGSYTDSWSLNSDAFTFEKVFNADEPIPAGGKLITDDGLLLIPQDIAAQQVVVTIAYYFQLSESDEKELREVQAFLPGASWEAGKSVTYVAKLYEDNEIKFMAPKIEPWATPQAGATIIIK